MAHDTLINELEFVRDIYSYRQKAATGAQTALQAIPTMLTKTERALRAYAEQAGTNAPEALEPARQALADARLKESVVDALLPDVRREMKAQATVLSAIKDALTALRGESVDIIRLGHALAALRTIKIQDAALNLLVPQLETILAEAQQSLSFTFGLAFRHALAEHGIALEGRPPRFTIGRFEIEANFVGRSATILYGKEVVVRKVALSVETIIKAYLAANKVISGRNEDPARWLENLYNAWESVRRKRGISEPRANIIECYMEVLMLRQPKAFRLEPGKHSFVDYSRAQFAYDFESFARSGYEYRGLRAFGTSATKSHTDNPERSLWMMHGQTPYDGAYIGDVKFDKDE
jgi:hypothetical protein